MPWFAPECPDIILSDFTSTCSNIIELSPPIRSRFADRATDAPSGEQKITFSDDLI
jgi:hypothetical protein